MPIQKRKDILLPASKVLQTLLANGKSPLSDGFLRWRIWRGWSDIVGETLGKVCEPVGFDRGRLIVWVSSSPRLQEIRFFEKTLRTKVNEHVGREWCARVVFTLDRKGLPAAERMDNRIIKYLDQPPSED